MRPPKDGIEEIYRCRIADKFWEDHIPGLRRKRSLTSSRNRDRVEGTAPHVTRFVESENGMLGSDTGNPHSQLGQGRRTAHHVTIRKRHAQHLYRNSNIIWGRLFGIWSEQCTMASEAKSPTDRPTVVVCIGMAGSGKTTFMHRLNTHLYAKNEPQFVVNLDPAVMKVPYGVNIDIRDSVDYKEVMRQYKLGPNGAIITSLNLFATKVDQVLGVLEKRAAPDPDHPERKPAKHILIDTPGQIEVFAWSASGQIILESLASSFPTVIAYIVDSARCSRTQTFMSNMLSACSILYKMKLPMILVFNKADVQDPSFAKEWMTDFDKFQAALTQEEEQAEAAGRSSYSHSMVHSMGLVFQEFYEHLDLVPASARTGTGIDEFFAAVGRKKEEFEKVYEPEMKRLREEKQTQKTKKREKELDKMMKGMSVGGDVIEKDKEMASPMDSGDELVGEEGEEDEDAGEGGEGLQSRYAAAFGSEGGSLEAEASYAKYLHSQR